MARIRTIKPEFFRHAALFDAELETGLPLRIGFAGLWTAADREGRFEWKPRQLKLDCLPFDDIDFSRVLDALVTRGHIVKYAIDAIEFGFIPSWHKHQIINNRETPSRIPEPSETSIESATSTRDARVIDATATPLVHAQGEGKGKEGKGKEGKGDSPQAPHAPRQSTATKPKPEPPTAKVWEAYADSYRERYGVEPIRNASVNGQLSQLIGRIPANEAPAVAAFYVHHENGLYRNAQHPVNLLLRDAESLRTQWVTNRPVKPERLYTQQMREQYEKVTPAIAAVDPNGASKPHPFDTLEGLTRESPAQIPH